MAQGVDLEHVDPSQVPTGSYDRIVIVTDHTRFEYSELQRIAQVVVDTRNAIKEPGPNVLRLGAPMRSVAEPVSA